jgi:hypothetical protein
MARVLHFARAGKSSYRYAETIPGAFDYRVPTNANTDH